MLKPGLALLILTLGFACGTKQPKVLDETHVDPKLSVSHQNLTTDCAGCHEVQRPPQTEDLNVTEAHGLGADCASCHTWPSFQKINVSARAHNPPPTKCLGCHSHGTEAPPHPKQGECAACHTFPVWKTIKGTSG